jgi:hypothetical protein
MTATSTEIVIVAQTPFHLFSAILIRQAVGRPADLWLLDPVLKRYERKCRELGVWREVFYAEVNAETPGIQSLPNRLGRLFKVRSLQNEIADYLRRARPSVVVIFSDNHEITAAFARLGKLVAGARVVMGEEGTASLGTYRRFRAGWMKRRLRRMLKIDNPEGYSIGWSPYIDALLLSDQQSAHADYLQQREVFQYPAGPYPNEALDEYVRMLDFDSSALSGRDIVYLGGAWDPSVAVPEMELLQELDRSPLGSRMLLKPHPFDPQGKYRSLQRMRVADPALNSIPAEIVLGRIQPAVVVSLTSSAIINYCLRYRRPGIFIALPALPPEVLRLFDDGLPKDPMLRVVRDREDLIAQIERALAQPKSAPSEAAAVQKWHRVIREAVTLEA